MRDAWYTWSQSYKTKSVKYNPSWTTWYIHRNLVQQINGNENWHKHVTKFDETFYNIWVHKLISILKAEKLWNIINGTVPKSIAPTAAQITTGTPALPAIGARSIHWWEEKDIVSYHILIVVWTIVSYTCSIMCNIKFSKDRASKIVPISRFSKTQMYLKDKVYTLKMKESDNVTKHVHLFRANLHQLTTIGATMLDDEAIICIMSSMPSKL